MFQLHNVYQCYDPKNTDEIAEACYADYTVRALITAQTPEQC